VKKGIAFCYILIFVLIGSASQTAFAQFAFEIPKRTTENFRNSSIDVISVKVSGKLALCSHSDKGLILLDITGGKAPYTFRWNTFETTKDRSNLNAGTYTVYITDAEGVKHTERIVIQPPYPLILDQINTKDATCGSASDGYAKISVKIGRGEPYKIFWSNGLKDVWEASNLAPGAYSVTVSDKLNCDVTVSFEIKSAAPGILVTDQVQLPSCSGLPDGKINLSVSGGVAPYSYKWTNGSTSKDLNSIAAGDYQVQITDQKGCTFQKSFKVDAPVSMNLSTSSKPASCEGNTDGAIVLAVSGGTTPYTYVWNTGATSKDVLNLSSGNYSVKVTDASGCIVEKQVVISTLSTLEVNLIESTNASCAGNADGQIQLGVKGAFGKYSVTWSDGTSGDLTRNNLKAGSYQITVTDERGCGITKSFQLTEPQALNARIESVLDVDCAIGSIEGVAWVSIQGGKEPYRITWNTGDIDKREINFSKSGIIKVQITDAGGCTIETETKVDFPIQTTQGGRIAFNYRKLEINSEAEVQVSEDIIFESVISDEFIAWEWEFGDGEISQDKDPIHHFEKAGLFDVILKAYDIYGCASQESKTIQVSNPAELVVMPNAFTPNGDGLNDTFIPKIKAVSSFTMDVFNTWGERIYSTNSLESKGWDGTSKGQILPASNYLYRITYASSDGRQFEKTGGITLIR
jgi:gliding motility-associated-like protein